ncbi:MAG: hypothetical protein K0Q96_1328 [Rubrobacteraceae bacterium]|jgi:hypothetical protein|nr:hypothetical protein [Rubrobacteraceae bacterium]
MIANPNACGWPKARSSSFRRLSGSLDLVVQAPPVWYLARGGTCWRDYLRYHRLTMTVLSSVKVSIA